MSVVMCASKDELNAELVRWCQSLGDDDTMCGQRATHIVKGRPGYWWQGFHCADHAAEVAQHYSHQGGCEVLLIDGQDPRRGGGEPYSEFGDPIASPGQHSDGTDNKKDAHNA